jgi:hypothetical protein
MAENEMDAGFRAITGVNAEEETVDVVGVSSWVNPGIVEDNVFIPRPLMEVPPALDEPGTATPDRDDGPDNVEEAGLDRAPAREKDVVGVVVAIDDFAGATVLEVVELKAVASLLRI